MAILNSGQSGARRATASIRSAIRFLGMSAATVIASHVGGTLRGCKRPPSTLAGIATTRVASKPRASSASRPRLPMVTTSVARRAPARSRRSRRGERRLSRLSNRLSEAHPPPSHSIGPPIITNTDRLSMMRAERTAFRPWGTRLKPITQSGRRRRARTDSTSSFAKARPKRRLRNRRGTTTRSLGIGGGRRSATRMISSTSGMAAIGSRCDLSWFGLSVTVTSRRTGGIRLRVEVQSAALHPSAPMLLHTPRAAAPRTGPQEISSSPHLCRSSLICSRRSSESSASRCA